METCRLLHLTNDEIHYVFEYVSNAEEGDPLYGFLDRDPSLEPFLFCKVRIVAMHDNYVEDGKERYYEGAPIPLDLLRLPESCAPGCLLSSLLARQFDLTVRLQCAVRGESTTTVNNDAVINKDMVCVCVCV